MFSSVAKKKAIVVQSGRVPSCLRFVLQYNTLQSSSRVKFSIWQHKRHWTGHVLRRDDLLRDVSEGRINGMPTRGKISDAT